MVEPLLQQDEIVAGGGLLAAHRLQQLLLEVNQTLGTGALIRRHQLGGSRRGRGAQVGGKVADGDIHLVAHRAHHRYGGVGNGARHRLFVKAPEIFEDPPPRPTISTSTSARWFALAIAATIWLMAALPVPESGR